MKRKASSKSRKGKGKREASSHVRSVDQDAVNSSLQMKLTSSIHSIKADDRKNFKPQVNKNSASLADNYRLRKMRNFADEQNGDMPEDFVEGAKTERKL